MHQLQCVSCASRGQGVQRGDKFRFQKENPCSIAMINNAAVRHIDSIKCLLDRDVPVPESPVVETERNILYRNKIITRDVIPFQRYEFCSWVPRYEFLRRHDSLLPRNILSSDYCVYVTSGTSNICDIDFMLTYFVKVKNYFFKLYAVTVSLQVYYSIV